MKQDDVVERVMIELLDNNMCARAFHYQLRGYLQQVYAAGYNEGRTLNQKRRAVRQFNLWGGFVKDYESASVAAKAVGVSRHAISLAALGKTHTAANFKWRYIDELPDCGKSHGDLP